MTSTETYEHAINGLLQKRREVMGEMAVIRERLGVLANDVEAIDRVLERLGHAGMLDAAPQLPRHVIFYRGQLRQWLLTELRERGPATSRALAERLAQVQRKDSRDKRMMDDLVNRVGRALNHMQAARLIIGSQNSKRGENIWRLSENEQNVGQ